MKHWPFALLPVFIAIALYLPNVGGSTSAIDWDAYERVLTTHEYFRTAILLFQDFKGVIVTGYYAPLSSVSLMMDQWLIGSTAPDVHFTLLVNLIIHCVNGILVYGLFIHLKLKPWIAGMACLIFLIHPLQVPSVLWFAERKTVMSCMFYLAAFVLYLEYRRSSAMGWYFSALLSVTLGLLSKPTVVVLPVALLITEMLGMSRADNLSNQSNSIDTLNSPSQEPLRNYVFKLAPFFMLSLIFGIVTLCTEHASQSDIAVSSRPFIASSAIVFYAAKVLFPINLMLVYPRWDISLSNPWWWVSPVGILVLLGLLLRFRALIPQEIWWGLGCFIVPLLPVIGFVGFGYFQHAFVSAHLMYLSMIGVSCCIAFAVYQVRSNMGNHGKIILTVLFAAWLCFMGIQTWNQTKLWKYPVNLWSDNLAKCPQCSGVHKMLGLSHLEAGNFENAIKYLTKALESEQDVAGVHMNIGAAYLNLNKPNLAAESFEKAINVKPNYARGHANLGLALLKGNRVSDAKLHLKKAIELNPDLALPYQNLGTLFEIQGDKQRAIEYYKYALQKNPNLFTANNRLGLMLMKSDNDVQALDYFIRAIGISPNHYDAQANAGLILLKQKKARQAAPYLEAALRLRPQSAGAHNNLGRTYEIMGKLKDARRLYDKAVSLSPDSVEIQYNLGNILVKLGQPEAALQHYTRCLKRNPKHFQAYHNKGAALLALGRLKEAADHFRKALEIKPNFQQAKTGLDIATKELEQDTKE